MSAEIRKTQASPFLQDTLPTGGAAKYLNRSTQTIRDYILQGRIRAFRVGPRNYRIPISELDRLITEAITPEGRDES